MSCRRDSRSAGNWSAPIIVQAYLGSYEIRIFNDYLITVMDGSVLPPLLEGGMRPLTGESIAGPVGVELSAASTAQVLSYTRQHGVLEGVSLSGLSLRFDEDENENLYRRTVTGYEILGGSVEPPASTFALRKTLDEFSAAIIDDAEESESPEKEAPADRAPADRERADTERGHGESMGEYQRQGAREPPESPRTSSTPLNPPPPPAQHAPVPVSVDEKLEKSLRELRKGNIAYNTPEKMKTGQTAHVTVRIGSDKVPAQSLISSLPADQGTRTEVSPTPVSTKMKVRLAGADFNITSLSSEEQVVLGDTPTTWEWDIEAKHSGKLRLHLAAVVEIENLSRDFVAVDRDILVQVDPVNEAEDFVKSNSVWILGTIGAAIGGVWAWLKRRKKPKLPDDWETA